MLRRIVLWTVLAIGTFATSAFAKSQNDAVRELKARYRFDLVYNSGHTERISAANVASKMRRNLGRKYAKASNITVDSGVKSYSEEYTVGVHPFKKKVKITRYISWAGAKLNVFLGNGPGPSRKVVLFNLTQNPIYYSISLNGNAFEEKRVVAGTHHWFRTNRVKVKFDRSYVPGYQHLEYDLQPGSQNEFKTVGNGIELYRR